MSEKYTLDILTDDNVSIKKEDCRKAYANSESGRQELKTEIPEPYLSQVLAIWGDVPTVIEELPESQEPTLLKPTVEDRLEAMEEALLFITLGGGMDV